MPQAHLTLLFSSLCSAGILFTLSFEGPTPGFVLAFCGTPACALGFSPKL
jgi:hypothetical protein